MKSLYNYTLNQIKQFNCDFKEKNDIIRDFEDYMERLWLQKAEVEEKRLQLTNLERVNGKIE